LGSEQIGETKTGGEIMARRALEWKKGRGKLGVMEPLLGAWRAQVLDGAFIQLTADWEFDGGPYKEIALIGVGSEGEVQFWSFTSDKKQSQGTLADVTDLHPQAIGFEAQMPAGLGRMAYWPDEKEGFHWVVESKTKKGWNRFTEHHYRKA
jgi:hypothetical protein